MTMYEDLGIVVIPVTDRLFCCHSQVGTNSSVLILANQKHALEYRKIRGE